MVFKSLMEHLLFKRSFIIKNQSGTIALNDAFDEKINLKDEIDGFNEYANQKSRNKKN